MTKILDLTGLTYYDTKIKDYISTGLSGKQDTLTAGTGIDITNNVISSTQASAVWGNITGTLSNQTDLQNALNLKLNTADMPFVKLEGVNHTITPANLTAGYYLGYFDDETSFRLGSSLYLYGPGLAIVAKYESGLPSPTYYYDLKVISSNSIYNYNTESGTTELSRYLTDQDNLGIKEITQDCAPFILTEGADLGIVKPAAGITLSWSDYDTSESMSLLLPGNTYVIGNTQAQVLGTGGQTLMIFPDGTRYNIIVQSVSSATITKVDECPEIKIQTITPTEGKIWIDPSKVPAGLGSQITNQYSVATDKTYSCKYIDDCITYSTTETLTNKTWIDGKPIYRKVISGTKTSGDVLATGVDTLTLATGTIAISTFPRLIPYFEVYMNNIYIGTVSLDGNSVKVSITEAGQTATRDCEITLEYTKTTD